MGPYLVLIYPDINFPFLLLSQIRLTGKCYGILVIIAVIYNLKGPQPLTILCIIHINLLVNKQRP